MSWLSRWNNGVGSSKDDEAAERERRRIARINELNRQLEEYNRRLREIEAEQKQIEQGVKELETCHEYLVSAIIDSEVIGQFDNVLSDADAYSKRYNELNVEKAGISSSISAITSELGGLGGTPVAIEKIVARSDLSTNHLSVFKNTYNSGTYKYNPDAMAEAIAYASKASGTLGDSKIKLNNGTVKDSVAGLYNKLTAMKNELDKLNGELLGANSNLLGNINLVPEVAAFLVENKGKTVAIPKNVKEALGLKMDALVQIPSNYSTSSEYSFLYWLVGTGHAQTSTDILGTASFVKSLVNGKYRNDNAIIYIPTGWGSGSTQNSDSRYNGDLLSNDLQILVNNLNINKNAISGAGTSIGAYAIAYLSVKNPNLFSAVAMTGGGFGGQQNNAAGISVEDAIRYSPGTTYIYYMANNDESSKELHGGVYGDGARTYTEKEYRKMLAAGMNVVYYEVGGDLWHTIVCDRFASADLINDLVNIRKGEKYNVPSDIQHITSEQSLNSAIDHVNGSNTWYVTLSNRQASESLNTASNGVIAYSQQGFQDENGVWHTWNEIYNWRSAAGNPIDEAGCSLAATASAIATQLHDSSINPATIGLIVGNGSNHGHDRMMSVIERYGLDCTDQIGLSNANQRQFIENGGVIMFSGSLGSNTDAGAHWYTILGIDDNGEYIIGNSYEQNGFGSEIPYNTGAAIYIAPKGYTVEQTLNSRISNAHPNGLTTLEVSPDNETLRTASAAVITAEAWAQTVAGKKAIAAALDNYGDQTTGQYIIKDLGRENNYMGNSIPPKTMDAIIEREYNKYLNGHQSGSTGGTTINANGFSGVSGKFGTNSGTITYSNNPAKNTVDFGISPESFKNGNSTTVPSNSGGSYNGGYSGGYYGGDSYTPPSDDTPVVEVKEETKIEPEVEVKTPITIDNNKDITTVIETNDNINSDNSSDIVENNEKTPEIINNEPTNQTETSTDIDNKNPVTIIDSSTATPNNNTQKSNVKNIYTSNKSKEEIKIEDEITPKTDFNVDGRFVDVPYNAPLTTEECPTDESSLNTSTTNVTTTNVTQKVIDDIPIFDVSSTNTKSVENNKNSGVEVGKVIGGIAAVGGVVAAGVAAKKLTEKLDNNNNNYEDDNYYEATDNNDDNYEEENYYETTDNYKNYNYEPENIVVDNIEEEKEEEHTDSDTYDLMNRKDIVIPTENDY